MRSIYKKVPAYLILVIIKNEVKNIVACKITPKIIRNEFNKDWFVRAAY